MSGLDVILYWFALTSVAVYIVTPAMAAGFAVLCAALLVAAPILLFAAPNQAPYIVAAVFGAAILIPSVLTGLASVQSTRDRNTRAWLFGAMAAILHPADGLPGAARFYRALGLRQRGREDAARAAFEQQAHEPSPLGLIARLQCCATRDDFYALLEDPRATTADPASIICRLRALGETGQVATMVDTYRTALAGRPPLIMLAESTRLLVVLILAGRPRGVAALHRGPLASMPDTSRQLHIARAQRAAGLDSPAAEATLTRLSAGADGLVAFRARLGLADPPGEARILDPARVAFLDHVDGVLEAMPSRHPWWRSWVTLVLVAANVAMFVAEIRAGGNEDGDVLYALGGLYTPDGFGRDTWWRLFTEMFLHAGPIHIGANMFGLLVLGIIVERMLGPWRYLLLYLGAGLGANVIVALAARQGWMQPELLVGASGALMGLIGGIAGSASRHWLAAREAVFKQRLVRIVFVIALQTAIDLTIPQVSATTHLAGVAVGFVLGWLLPFRWPPPSPITAIAAFGAPLAAAPIAGDASLPNPVPAPATRRRSISLALAGVSIAASLLIASYQH